MARADEVREAREILHQLVRELDGTQELCARERKFYEMPAGLPIGIGGAIELAIRALRLLGWRPDETAEEGDEREESLTDADRNPGLCAGDL